MRWVAESKYLHCRGLCPARCRRCLQTQLAAPAGCRVGVEQAEGRSRQPGLGPGWVRAGPGSLCSPSPGIWQQRPAPAPARQGSQEEPGSALAPSWVPIQAAQSHGITEVLRREKTFQITTPIISQQHHHVHISPGSQVPHSHVFEHFVGGDSTPTLGSLFQCFPTLPVKKFSQFPV